jgi:transcriptional regulator with XRE-family HTH domain/tetratricopeptide (TPR) repeat protein
MSWWVDLGYPPFEKEEGGFPRTGQVIRHYREKKRDDAGRTWTQSRLAEFLTVTEKAVWDIEKRDASVDVARRQRLSQCLDIPSVLLGIRTREEILKVIEERRAKQAYPAVLPSDSPSMWWWVELGYPSFAPGKDGFFPRTGEVVKYYRGRAMDTKGKPWTQRRLANVLGIETDQAVWNLENRDTALDIERRRFLSELFDIPPMLFGIITLAEIGRLVEQRRKASSEIVIVSTRVSTSHKLTIDAEECTALLDSYWTTFLSNPTQISMTNIDLCIDALYHELPRVREKKPLQELLCRFHDLAANILCDQQEFNDAMVQLEKASSFAALLKSDELKALVLYDYGYALWTADRFDKALEKYEEGRRYEQRVPRNLRNSLLLETGSTKALVAQTPEKRDTAITLVDRVGNSLRSKGIEEDPYFLGLDLDRYHLIRSESLIAVGRNKEAIEELELVKAGPEYPRRQAYKDIYRAQAHTNLGEYSEAASFATSGLVILQEVNSVKNITHVERMYKKFPRGLFKHNDDVARLEYLLNKRKARRRL